MKKRLTNNFGLKIASVFFAIIIWFLIVNVDDPVMTRTYDGIEVKIINGAIVEDSYNKSYRVEDNKNNISVTIKAKRSLLNNISLSDISATADMTQTMSFESSPALIPINVTCNNVPNYNITSSRQNLEVVLENLLSRDYIITPTTNDSSPGKGYEIGQMKVEPEKITITGPESTINKIDKVTAPIDVSDMASSKSIPSVLCIVDKNADGMSETQTSYLRYSTGEPQVKVYVELWAIRSNVRINVSCSGEPRSGYKVTEVAATPETLSVAGTEEALSLLAEAGNEITIPDSVVSCDGASADFEKRVDITRFLPDNTKLATNESDAVLVRVKVLPFSSKEFELATNNIKVSGKKPSLSIVYATDKIAIRVKGPDSDLEALKPDKIKASIDLTGKNEGAQDIPVVIKLPDGYELVAPVTVSLRLDKTNG